MGLGSDIMAVALEGYALAKVFGKGSGLESLREAMSARVSHKGKNKGKPPGSE